MFLIWCHVSLLFTGKLSKISQIFMDRKIDFMLLMFQVVKIAMAANPLTVTRP